MKIAVIGGTGFVGLHLLRHLLNAGYQPKVLLRPGSINKLESPERCEVVSGNISEITALRNCLAETSAVIYLIGILREFPAQGITFEALQYQGVIDTITAAQTTGVTRFLLMSANGVKPEGTAYQRTKYHAEQALKSSSLNWTIFRPSVIFGDPAGRMEFCSQLKKDLIDAPLPIPLFYNGLLPFNAGMFELAPVSVTDVTAAMTLALREERTIFQTYSLCGPDRLTWKMILTTIANACGKTKLMVPAPTLAINAAAWLLERYPWFPLTRDQLTMLLESNICTENDSFARLGLTPTRFTSDQLKYLH